MPDLLSTYLNSLAAQYNISFFTAATSPYKPLLTQKTAAKINSTTAKLNVLMIDDEEICLNSTEVCLLGSDYNFIGALGGKAGLEYLLQNPAQVDIILLDLMMPDIYGLEVISTLKKHQLLKDIPIILQTATANYHEVEEALRLGALTYISKPYNREVLISALMQVYAGVV